MVRGRRKCCGKIAFRDEIAAKLALAEAQRNDGSKRPKLEKRVYRCEHGRWHLTAERKWHGG